jgi:SAM-dependent methyltransferase
MQSLHLGFAPRAWRRLTRLSHRAGQELRGLPIRAACRGTGLPIPPGRLIHLVAGTTDAHWFLASGAMAAESIRRTLERNGRDIESFRSVLDFGCGVGRVIRHWHHLTATRLHGTDYNPRLVSWCRKALTFAQFEVNALDRPLPYADASFDLVYALSVFTHLSEPLQHRWIAELARVLAPGGYLLITTHGEHYLDQLSPHHQADFRAGRLVVLQSDREGTNDCAAFHPESYIRATLAPPFEVLDFAPEAAWGNPRQDVTLMRKPESSAPRSA